MAIAGLVSGSGSDEILTNDTEVEVTTTEAPIAPESANTIGSDIGPRRPEFIEV